MYYSHRGLTEIVDAVMCSYADLGCGDNLAIRVQSPRHPFNVGEVIEHMSYDFTGCIEFGDVSISKTLGGVCVNSISLDTLASSARSLVCQVPTDWHIAVLSYDRQSARVGRDVYELVVKSPVVVDVIK